MDETRCIEQVPFGGRMVGSHQCQRKRGHGKDGLYCYQHAKHENILKTVYVARISRYGSPNMAEVNISHETKKTIFVHSSNEILGYFYFGDSFRKSKYPIFDTQEEAIDFLMGRLSGEIESLETEIKRTKSEITKLREMKEDIPS